MILAVQSWILVLVLLALECRSHYLGDVVRSVLPDTQDFEVPAGASIIVDFEIEVQGEKTKDACDVIERGRRCMNVSKRVPIKESRNCRGDGCLMYLTPGPPICMIDLKQRAWDPTNSTRKHTCGLEMDDHFVQNPGKPVYGSPGSNAEIVFYGMPPGVHLKVFYLCLMGELQAVSRVSFPRYLADNYTCMESPKCIDGKVSNQIVCYTMGGVRFSMVNTGFSARSQSMLMLAALLLTWLAFWGH